jgi:spore maturation protein CgeB
MKIVMFYHSLISDWNHGNAHFLRGIFAALQRMGHEVSVLEPKDNWSLSCLLKEKGNEALIDFMENFPDLRSNFYTENYDELRSYLQGADLVIVHEWTAPDLISWIGEQKDNLGYKLFFHDTHHRGVSEPEAMERLDLSAYDAVLAFGESLKKVYQNHKWHDNVYSWHEAADISHYFPIPNKEKVGDVVWIGNWGDDERTEELEEFLIEPIHRLNLKATFYGVRYPDKALETLKKAGIDYGGYLPTSKVAETFAAYKTTIHVPRRFYTKYLPGIPTIRPFEALACGIPLLSAPWQDTENLFTLQKDFLMVSSGEEMIEHLDAVIHDQQLSQSLSSHGLDTIIAKHTCMHRANELLAIYSLVTQEMDVR